VGRWTASEARYDTWWEDLEIYALGQLGRRRFAWQRDHLADCPPSCVELVDLQEVVTWLGRVKRHLTTPGFPITGLQDGEDGWARPGRFGAWLLRSSADGQD